IRRTCSAQWRTKRWQRLSAAKSKTWTSASIELTRCREFLEVIRATSLGPSETGRGCISAVQGRSASTGLRFKKVHASRPIYSVRVTRGYRALGILENETVTWFWIG